MWRQASPGIDITYVGGPTATLSIGGLKFITDPTFDPSGRGYPRGDYALKKTRGPALAVRDLGTIDVALVSHDQHPDNLDDAGRALLSEIPLVLTTPAGAQRLGPPAFGLAPWATYGLHTPDGFGLRVTATPARHGPVGIESITGDVTGFVISVQETGEDIVYVTGDTVWFDGTREVARRFGPRVVLLFGGAAQVPRGRFNLTMNGNDAIEVAAAFPRSSIVPVHHDGWEHFTESQDDLLKVFSALGRTDQLRVVTGGETLAL